MIRIIGIAILTVLCVASPTWAQFVGGGLTVGTSTSLPIFATLTINSAVVGPTNGLYTNLLQGNAVISATNPIFAQETGSYPVLIASSTMTRASNTTTYTANTAVCLNTSTTACVPMTVSLATTNAGKGLINRVLLLKSSATTTNASFNIWFYSTTPTTTSIYDDTAYVGPFKADVPYYIGSATCSTANVTTDGSASVWFECTLNNPNTGGAIPFQAATGSTNISAMLEVTAAYAPASAETFTFYVSGVY